MLIVPYLITVLVGLSGLTWAIHLAIDPDPFAASSAAPIAVGIVIFTVIAVAGILLVRARWVRAVALAVIALGLGVGVITGFDAWAYLATAFSLAAIVGLLGPWLDIWLRGLPAPDGPGPKPTVMTLATLGVVPLIGFAAPQGLKLAHVALATTAVVLAWGYTRSWRWGLWGLRFVLPGVAIWAAIASPWPGAVLIVLWTVPIVALAWSRDAGRAIAGQTPPLPAPRRRRRPPGAPEEREGVL